MSEEFITRAVRCPACQTAFTHDQVVLPREIGRDSDYRPVFADRNPLAAQVLSCPTCRYSAYVEGFEEDSELSDEERLMLGESAVGLPRAEMEVPGDDEVGPLRRFLKNPELMDWLPSGEPFGAARYVLAARCHEFLNEDDLEGAMDLYLRASWCARAANDAALEERCQREVLSRLKKRLDEKKVAEADKPRALYLMAELSRRAGEFTTAVSGFEELRQSVDAEDEDGLRWRERARRLEALASMQSAVNAPWTDELPEDDGAPEVDEDEG